jgi:hypothetical protein
LRPGEAVLPPPRPREHLDLDAIRLGLLLGTIAAPCAHEKRAPVQPGLGALAHAAFPLFTLPQLPDKTDQPIGPDPHLERVLLHLDPLDELLDDPLLLAVPADVKFATLRSHRRVGLTAAMRYDAVRHVAFGTLGCRS